MSDDPTRPSGYFAAVTPSDTVDITKREGNYPRAFYVGVAGDVVAIGMDGVAVTFKATVAGTILPIRAKRINDTGTTPVAGDIVALY